MTGRKKLLIALAVVLASYLLALVVLGAIAAGSIEERVRDRLAFTLRADEVVIDDVDVSLLRGKIILSGVHANRTGIGTASVEVAVIDIDIPRMGLAIVDAEPRRIAVDGAHLELSAVGAATLRSEDSEPLQLEEFTIKNSSVELVATSFFPKLGKAKLSISHAHAVDLEINDAMSWLYETDTLSADLHAPGGIDLGLEYAEDSMSLRGSVLGADPITVPFSWPLPDPRDLELTQILSLGKKLTEIVAKEYLKRKAKELWKGEDDDEDDE